MPTPCSSSSPWAMNQSTRSSAILPTAASCVISTSGILASMSGMAIFDPSSFKTVGHLAQMAGVRELDIELEGCDIRDFLMEVSKHTD